MASLHKRCIISLILLLGIVSFFFLSATADFGALTSGQRPLADHFPPSLTVSCAPEQPVVHLGDPITVRTWTTDPTGKALIQAPRFIWSVSAGRISGTDTATWILDNPILDAHGVLQVTAQVTVQDPLLGQGNCQVQVIVVKQREVNPVSERSGRLSGRMLLLPTHTEPKGYGLYSYLIFGTPPKDDVERERYLQALESYLRILQPIEELEHYTRRSELNITLIPVKKNVELPNDLNNPGQASQAAKQVLAAYDYARASALLAKLDRQSVQSGPFLVSLGSTAPNPDTLFLFFDMSHATPKLAWDWVKAFCWLVAQERSWSEIELTRLSSP